MAFSHSFLFWSDGQVHFLDLHSPNQAADINRVITGTLPPSYTPLEPEGVKDTLMVLTNRKAPAKIGRLRTSSRYLGYGPTVTLLALVLATPLSRRRRGRALFWGLLLVHGFILFRLTLTLTAGGYAAAKDYALFHPGPFWSRTLTHVEAIFADDPTVSFVVPACIWFLVAVSGTGWAMFRPRIPETKPSLT